MRFYGSSILIGASHWPQSAPQSSAPPAKVSRRVASVAACAQRRLSNRNTYVIAFSIRHGSSVSLHRGVYAPITPPRRR